MTRRLAIAAAAVVLAAAGCSSDTDDATGDVVEVPGVVSAAGSVAVLPDLSRVVAPCDGDVCQWTLEGRYVGRFDGGAIVAVSDPGLYTDRVRDGVVELVLLDPASGEEVRSVEAYAVDDVQDGAGQGLRDIAFSPDGSWVAAVGADGVVRRWSAEGLSDEVAIDGAGDAVAAAFSPDGSLLAVASSDAPVTLHDSATGDVAGQLDALPQGAVEWSEDGWIATASFTLDDAAATTVWDGETREAVATLAVPAYRLDVAGPGTLLLTEKEELDVVRWQWEEDQVIRYTGATDVPRAVTHTATGPGVVAVSPRDGVLAWDADGGQPTTFEEPEG